MSATVAPQRVGRYEIVRLLSKSMTDVYLAIDTVENRRTALKLIKPAPDAMTQLVLEAERRGVALQRELRALDPRVVEVYESGEADGYYFIAMQYVEGWNVAETLEREGRMEPRRAAQVARDLCGQLVKFHGWQRVADGQRTAVVHGDIKPSNIHLGPNDTVRLLDFGIAKALRVDRDATQHQFGSPGYCSPERLATMQVDQYSDLWALGATLYEMLAGAPPYSASDTRQLERLIQTRRPPRALPVAVPRALRQVVGKAMAADPARRYRTAQVFHDDLEAFLEGRATVAEAELRGGWNASATIEAAREALHRATRTLAWRHNGRQMASGAGWFLLGMALWIGGSSAWQGWQAWLTARTAPAVVVDEAAILRSEYLRNGDRAIDEWRASAEPLLRLADWTLAQFSLGRAVELGSRDSATLGKQALSQGYVLLLGLIEGRVTAEAAPQQRLQVRDLFLQASIYLPQSPDPHLGLARVYVYSLPDVERAMGEFRLAEKLGYRLTPREWEEQGDAWRLEAARALAAGDRAGAREAAGRALRVYAPIRGYHLVDARVRELERLLAGMARARRPRRWR
jgi:eukaryotic-like serine/threonine-protein kinase